MLGVLAVQSYQLSNAAPNLLDQLTDRPQLEAVSCWCFLLQMSAASWRSCEVQQHLSSKTNLRVEGDTHCHDVAFHDLLKGKVPPETALRGMGHLPAQRSSYSPDGPTWCMAVHQL